MLENYLTIDVEDYFQVSAFNNIIRYEQWDIYESRIVNNTHNVLEILSRHNTKATFFVLGWIAEKYPNLIKDIFRNKHEIACHGYAHRLVYEISPEEFIADTKKAKDILENIIGKSVIGYRAASYSITRQSMWALDILEGLGFEYDSSIFPIHHDRYGLPEASRFKYKLSNHNLIEYPLSTSMFFGMKVPVAGGGYFRLFPYNFTKLALNKINKRENQSFVFYIHPWELDPEQPKMNGINYLSKFRHYNNLGKAKERFFKLLQDFRFTPITKQE